MKILAIIILHTLLSQVTAASLTEQLQEKRSSSKAPAEVKKIMSDAQKSLKESGIEKNAINIGSKIPEFKIENKSISDFLRDSPIVLKFYRGSWCPYCQIELKEYNKYKTKIEDKGYKLIILTPDTNKEIRKFKAKNNIELDIYQDKDNSIAKKFGIAFKLDKNLKPIYKKFGIDLEAAQENKEDTLPLPGTYIINKEGKITYAFIDVDYTKRLDPEILMKNLK